jgi:hypothetical protein
LNPQRQCIAYEVPAVTPFVAYVDDEVADEMDEYGYSGLDQAVHEDDENDEVNEDKYASGPEDGEDVTNEFKQDSFASL